MSKLEACNGLTTTDKDIQRAQLEADMAAFLAKGKQVTELAYGPDEFANENCMITNKEMAARERARAKAKATAGWKKSSTATCKDREAQRRGSAKKTHFKQKVA